ncbi:DUF2459 domain-containing protein [Altererythrobacter aestuarii]|uniref:DUF2459 domain-containing protein n=1 Tax=Alteraurantiacibacter aestuarii TaxID=650004 RepID=A0A844ZGJ1_9SPHN|nr:DUF2459 domain-containing protein [Alteraurantiacibacter aestuarii]
MLGVVLAVALFPVLGWIGSSIPRNAGAVEPADGVEIMVETNGTHTGIVMPIVTPEVDWRTIFPSASTLVNGQLPTHIAVGWGEREIFLNVPTWDDLTAATAVRIALFGGDSIMRVSHYVRPAPDENYRPVTISRAAYARMATRIEQSLAPPGPDGSRQILRGTNPRDAYYDARGHYTLANSCNSWVGDMLAEGGVEMGWWTPFAGGVMKWIEKPQPG